MLLFRVSFQLYHLLLLCKINFRHTKEKEDSVAYFNHFQKDFIWPYGLAHDAQSFDAVTLSRRLNNFNCEFFIRPQFTISEFAETLSANLKYIEGNVDILEPKSIQVFLKKAKR